MPPTRLRVDAPDLEVLRRRLQVEYGGRARVVAAERVVVGGFRGRFARRYVEAEIEIDDAVGGLDALLARADAADESVPTRAAPGTPSGSPQPAVDGDREPPRRGRHRAESPVVPLSTEQPEFARLLDELTLMTGAPGSKPPMPSLASAAGDVITVLGEPVAALETARSMAAEIGGAVAVAGAIEQPSLPWLHDRRSTDAFRASCVTSGRPGVVAVGVPDALPLAPETLDPVRRMPTDQVWVVVDARRKPDDTARWFSALAAAAPVDALAVIGSTATASPETVQELGVPVGWVEGAAGISLRPGHRGSGAVG